MTLEHKNQKLQELVSKLKKHSIDNKCNVWKKIALELERPTRQHRAINVSRIEKYSNDNDVVIVPGKVLSGGDINKKVTVVAATFSRSAEEKIAKKGSVMSFEEAMKKYPKGENLKIIG